MATRDIKIDIFKLDGNSASSNILGSKSRFYFRCYVHCLRYDLGTCVDSDGLLHVESDIPQELSEEKQNDKIHPRLRRMLVMMLEEI